MFRNLNAERGFSNRIKMQKNKATVTQTPNIKALTGRDRTQKLSRLRCHVSSFLFLNKQSFCNPSWPFPLQANFFKWIFCTTYTSFSFGASWVYKKQCSQCYCMNPSLCVKCSPTCSGCFKWSIFYQLLLVKPANLQCTENEFLLHFRSDG